MIIVWGTKLYGKVDEIEGVGYVATQFGHLFWLPLIPFQSFFVTRDGKHDFDGVPIGLNLKSVLAGYGRVFSVLFILGGLGALNALYNPHEVLDAEKIRSAKIGIGLGLFSIPLCIASYLRSVREANYETATALAAEVGLDQRLRTYIEFCYGRISEAEADQRMDSIEARENDGTDWDGDAELAAIYQRYMTA